MSETALTSGQANALSGTTDSDTDMVYPTIGESTYYTTMFRVVQRLLAMATMPGNSLRVFKDGDLTFGVRAGHFMDGDTARNYAGASAQALTDDQTNYIYLTAAATLTVNITGFPNPSTTPHVPLATILTGSGAYAYTDITDYRDRALYRILTEATADAVNNLQTIGANGISVAAAVFGTWAVDGDGAETNGGGMVGDVTLTEAAAAYCKVYDHGTTTYANLSASGDLDGWAANYQLTADADSEQVNDAAYFGHTLPFCELAFDLSQGATHDDDSFAWEYWNGAAWVNLPGPIDHTSGLDEEGQAFAQDGALQFVPPSNWATTTVDGQSAYWIRCRVQDTTITQTPILNSKEHEIVTPTDGIKVAYDGQITDIRATDGTTGTIHTNNTVKFLLMNFTTGEHSGELSWVEDQRSDAWSSLTLDVNAGDELGVLVTQEDETDEIINAMLEMIILPA